MNHFPSLEQHQYAQQQAAEAIVTIKKTIESFQKDANLETSDIDNIIQATQILKMYSSMIRPISLFGRIMNWFTNTRGHRVSAYEEMSEGAQDWLNSVENLNTQWQKIRRLEDDIINNPPVIQQDHYIKNLTVYKNQLCRLSQ